MGAGEMPTVTGRSRNGTQWLPSKSPASSRVQPRVEQVAAVCYRIRGTTIEFLLVRTRKGRWTFPKGGAEAGLTYAQAAAVEAFEEAGVHGRIEEASFARYRRGKRGDVKESAAAETVVHAFLCEVLRLGGAQEVNRHRTWFSAEKAKSELCESRTPENGADLARVVDYAVARIERLRSRAGVATDALQKVHFEASEVAATQGRMKQGLLPGRIRARDYVSRFPRVIEGNAGGLQNRKVVQINRPRKTTENG